VAVRPKATCPENIALTCRCSAEVSIAAASDENSSAQRTLILFLGEEPTGAEDRPGVKREIGAAQNRDERWRERRGLARRLIDLGDAATAYRIVREATPPANPYYRAEYH
jgi:hypothetical protein